MATPRLTGIWPIIPTPLTADEQLDEDALRRIIEFELAAGVNGLWLLGSRGEGPNLDGRTHIRVIQVAKEAVGGQVPLIAGCAAPGTKEAVANMRRAEDAGADLIQVAEPYYYHPREPWILAHYDAIIEAANLPLVLYFLPQRHPYATPGSCPEVIRRFAPHPRCIGMKAATLDFAMIESMVVETKDFDFDVTVAAGKMVYTALMIGASGATSPESAFLPKLYVDLYEAVQAGDHDRAWALQQKAFAFSDVFGPPDVPSGKAALVALGLAEEHLSMPFLPMPEPERSRLIELLRNEYGPEHTSPALRR